MGWIKSLTHLQVQKTGIKKMQDQIKEKMEQFGDWLLKTIRPEYRNEVEQYLSQATDACDLEYRIRTLRERGHAL